jgi:cytochrome c oxidase subunit 4
LRPGVDPGSQEEIMAASHPEPNYMAIWFWLAVLTVVEIWVARMGLPKPLMISGLIGLAVAKAALVALYFMHLRFERRTLGIIALTPPFLLVLLTCAVYPDALGAALDRVYTRPPAAAAAPH